jgi:hypothetical protein
MSNDNKLVFDSKDSYNLEFEITFLEFFEILIGCALRLNEKKTNTKISKKKQLKENSPAEGETQTPIDVNAGSQSHQQTNQPENNNNNSHQQHETSVNQAGEYCEHCIATHTIELPNIDPLPIVLEMSQEELAKKQEQEFNEWVEKINFFFEKKFFAAAENYETLTRLANISIGK